MGCIRPATYNVDRDDILLSSRDERKSMLGGKHFAEEGG